MFNSDRIYKTHVSVPDYVLDTSEGRFVVDVYDSNPYSLVPIDFVRKDGGKIYLVSAPIGDVYVKYTKY
jgi:hypothetical protein